MTVCDRGRGGQNHQKKRDILYGRPLMCDDKIINVGMCEWAPSSHRLSEIEA